MCLKLCPLVYICFYDHVFLWFTTLPSVLHVFDELLLPILNSGSLLDGQTALL